MQPPLFYAGSISVIAGERKIFLQTYNQVKHATHAVRDGKKQNK